MNYYFALYKGLFVLPIIIILAIVLIALIPVYEKILFKLFYYIKPNNKWFKHRIAVAIILAGLSILSIIIKVPDYFLNGQIHLCYITELDNQKYLSIWFAREESANMLEVYTQRFKSYDISSGKELGKVDAVHRSHHNDFQLFGPFGIYAWGYSSDTNLQLLNIFEPKIIYSEKDIIKKNPSLGSLIRLSPYNPEYIYDDRTNQIPIVTNQGDIYWLNPDLKIVKDTDSTPEVNPLFEHIGKSYWLGEWEEKNPVGNNVWVSKNDSDQDKIGCVISYLNSFGKELNSIDLCQMFYNETRPYALLPYNNEILIFVTRKGYSLTALRTNPETGALIGQIDYF